MRRAVPANARAPTEVLVATPKFDHKPWDDTKIVNGPKI